MGEGRRGPQLGLRNRWTGPQSYCGRSHCPLCNPPGRRCTWRGPCWLGWGPGSQGGARILSLSQGLLHPENDQCISHRSDWSDLSTLIVIEIAVPFPFKHGCFSLPYFVFRLWTCVVRTHYCVFFFPVPSLLCSSFCLKCLPLPRAAASAARALSSAGNACLFLLLGPPRAFLKNNIW